MTRRDARFLAPLVCLASVTCLVSPLRGQPAADSSATAEGTVRELYRLVSFEPGADVDWDAVRALFLPEAVVVLRTSWEATTVFSLDGFVQDFVDFIAKPGVHESGFTERIVRLKPVVFGDMAHIFVVYEAHITGSERSPQQGLDSFQVIRKDGKWRIASAVNELPTKDRPLPPELEP